MTLERAIELRSKYKKGCVYSGICTQCRNVFYITRRFGFHGKFLYCSHKCVGESQKRIINKKCSTPNCSNIVSKSPSCFIGKRKFCSHKCYTENNTGTNHPSYKGGFIGKDGYRYVSNGKRNILEHRKIMQIILGRQLLPHESIHHKNGIRHDNRPENLELWVNQPYGQRVSDIISYVAKYHPEKVLKAINRT